MKARIIPIYFESRDADEFFTQVQKLTDLLAGEVEMLAPVALGKSLPEADAVVFPQLLGEAYRRAGAIRKINLPILIITSEFGTVSMWDWEIRKYLTSLGTETIAPYNLEQSRLICRAIGIKRELSQTKFVVYQDNPGEGFQPEIFKRFYWWEDECTERMGKKFGVKILKKSFRTLGAAAQQIPDSEVEELAKPGMIEHTLSQENIKRALKVFAAVKKDIETDPAIRAAGINCLNESQFSDTTPCLAWSLLYDEKNLIWGCEADTMSMLTQYIVTKILKVPNMMTNLYPFLMGQAALKHEHIPYFPEVDEPDNHILAAHCGYFGVIPRSFAESWTLRPKVLDIVNNNACAIDARLPIGPITLVKMHPSFEKLSVIEGTLTGYAQFPDSHCLNGPVIRVRDGHAVMESLVSHHYILVTGHVLRDLQIVAKAFKLDLEIL